MSDFEEVTAGVGLIALSRVKVLGKLAAQNYRRSQLTRMAAALSFRTIFGLIPTLVVGLVVLHSFVSESQLRGVIRNVLDYTGLDRISIQTAEETRPGESPSLLPPGAQSKLSENPQGEITFFGPPTPQQAAAVEEVVQQRKVREERLSEWITKLLDRIDAINFGAVGIIGVVLLIYAALSMIVEIEKSFNQMLDVLSGKNWVRRVRDYWALLTLGPLLLVMSFGVRQAANNIAEKWAYAQPALTQASTDALASAAPQVSPDALASVQSLIPSGADQPGLPLQSDRGTGWRGAIIKAVAFATTVAITTFALIIVFTTVPNGRVQVMGASAGALLSALLWETSKWAFTSYLAYSTSYARLYGVLALVPLFLLWVYVTWLVILLGFQVTAILQSYHKVSREGFQQSVLIALGLTQDPDAERRSGVQMVDPATTLLLMCAAAQKFASGKPTSLPEFADAAGLRPDVVVKLLDALSEQRMLHRVLPRPKARRGKAHSDESAAPQGSPSSFAEDADLAIAADGAPPLYALARSPEEIPAVEVLRIGDALLTRDKPAPVLDAIREAKHRALEGKSLADVRASLARAELDQVSVAHAPTPSMSHAHEQSILPPNIES